MSAGNIDLRFEVAVADAAAKGCVVVEPKENELFIDIDRVEDFEYFQRQIEHVIKYWPATYTVHPSPSKRPGRYHVIVRFDRPYRTLDAWQRIALQAVLGSDRIRELISVFRIMSGDPKPTLFFEKKDGGT